MLLHIVCVLHLVGSPTQTLKFDLNLSVVESLQAHWNVKDAKAVKAIACLHIQDLISEDSQRF